MKAIAINSIEVDPKLEELKNRIETAAALNETSIGSESVWNQLNPLLNITAIALTEMSFDFPDDNALQLTAQGALFGQSVKITGVFTIADDELALTLNNYEATLSLSIQQLVEYGLLPTGYAPEFLPTITISDIRFIFDSTAQTLTLSSGPGGDWNFLGYGDLFVADPKINLIRNNGTGLVNTTATATGALASTDKKVNIAVIVGLPVGPGGWSAGLAAPITLDQGPALLDALLQTDVSGLLPETFTSKLETIELTAFYLTFDAIDKSISSLQVIVNTKQDWVIIEDKLKLNKGINLTLSASRTETTQPLVYNGSINASAGVNYADPSTIVEASADIPIPLTENNWTITLGKNGQDMGLGRLVGIIPGVNAVLPKGLTDQLDKVVMEFLSISFKFGGGNGFAFTRVAFSIRSDEEWQLPMLQSAVYLDELHFALDAAFPYKAETTSGDLGGNIQIASGEVTIPVSIGKTNEDPNWLLTVTSDEIPLPSLTDLADFMGADVLKSASPSGLLGIGNFSIVDLNLKWALGTGSKLEVLAFTVQSTPGTPAWNLVPGYFELSDLYVSISIENKTVSDKNISGEIGTTVTLVLNKEKDKKLVLGMVATKPSSAEPWNFSGTLEENLDLNELLLGLRLPKEVVDILPALTVTQFDLAIEPASGSFSTSMTIENTPENTWTIATVGAASVTLDKLFFSIEHYAENTELEATGNFNIGTEAKVCPVTIGATYKEEIWKFTGLFDNKEGLTINEVLSKYINGIDADTIPQLAINNIKVSVEKGPAGVAVAAPGYSVLDFYIKGTLTIPVIESFMVTGAIDLKYDSRKDEPKRYDGTSLNGTLQFGGLSFSVLATYNNSKFSTYVFQLVYKNITVQCEADVSDPDIVKFSFLLKSTDPNKGLSLGDLISTLIGAATGEAPDIPSPWDFINNIPLDSFGFVFTYNKTTKAKTIGLTYKPNINLGFITIEELSLLYSPQANADQGPVQFLVTKGTFLGVPLSGLTAAEKPGWDLRNPQDAPKVPGMGDSAFKLENLSLGNQVGIYPPPPPPKSVVQAIEDLEKAFSGEGEGLPLSLRFDKNIGVLVGAQFTLIKYIDIAIVFYDPVIYGASINVKGGQFNGLYFQVLYKKVTDNVGVFQIDLTLPDIVRKQQFGVVSLTLPSMSLSIYTNGDFLIDFGFPYNADFSRSFGLEFSIFTGAGGFYFGKLSNDTATDFHLPAGKGQFNPVIAFGIGIRAGVGRSVDKGILKAGLSLTLQVILEGIIASYESNQTADTTLYFRIQAQAALVGRIYGEINFAIISASIDITAKIFAALMVEAYRATEVLFGASVSASVSVRINLGLFKITISCSFSTTISQTFTLGSNNPPGPWDKGTLLDRRAYFTALDDTDPIIIPEMDWTAAMVYPKQGLEILFLPQLSVKYSAGTSTHKQAVGVSLLYVSNDPASGADTNFTALGRAMLAWAFNAYFAKNGVKTADILDQPVTIKNLNEIFAYLSKNEYSTGAAEPFSTDDILDYLFEQSFNKVTLSTKQQTTAENAADPDQPVAVFPMFPIFKMSVTGQVPIDFLKFGECDTAYLEAVKAYFEEMKVQFNNEQEPENALIAGDSTPSTLAEFLFADYFVMVMKSCIQDAIDEFKETSLFTQQGESLRDVAARYADYGADAAQLAFVNRREPLSAAASLRIPAFTCRLRHGESADSLLQRFPEVPNLLTSAAPGKNNMVSVSAFDYPLTAHNGVATLWSVSERFNLDFEDLLAANVDRKDLFAPGSRLLHAFTDTKTVRQILDDLQKGEKFSLSNAGGMASRFFLHGLRIPADVTAESRKGLFEATGQQFEFKSIKEGDTVALSINTGSTKPEWLKFENANDTSFPVTAAMVTAAGELESSAFVPPLKLDAQADVKRYRLQAKSFSLPDGLQWQDPNPAAASANLTESFIWKFPTKLQQYLSDNEGLPFELDLQSRTTSFTQRALGAMAPRFWSTSVDVVIMQIPSPGDPENPMEQVYAVQGCGDADGQLLELLIQANPAIVNLDILFAENAAKDNDGKKVTGLQSNPLSASKTFLLQTNYSTVSNPGGLAAADADLADVSNLVGMDAVTFLTYLWECSIVRSGGYYLFYNNGTGGGLPTYLFGEDGKATITVFISYNLQPESGTTAFVLPAFVNSVVIDQKIDPKQDNLYVAVYLTEAQLAVFDPTLQTITSTVLPGTGQFRGTRANPSLLQPTSPGESADVQLSELFNLLEFRIQETPGIFTETRFALPAGPVVVNESGPAIFSAAPQRATAADGWIYNGVLPIFPFADPSGPNEKDPYRANGKTATVYFNFLDLFGNTLFPDGKGESGSGITQTITPGYTDAVIGLDQWVNVAKYYVVAADAGTGKPTLTITLKFDKSRYTDAEDPKEVAKRDLEFYQNVIYQLAQPDVTVNVGSTLGTLLPPAETPLKKLQDYLAEISKFLQSLATDPAEITTALSFVIDTDNLNPELIFALVVNIGIERTANIDPQFVLEPGIRFADTPVPANLYHEGAGSESALDIFAAALEKTLPVMRVTVGQSKPTVKSNKTFSERLAAANDTAADDVEVWLVRYAGATGQPGIAFTVDPLPAYFATKPLSTKLLSRPDDQHPNPVPIRTYTTGTYLGGNVDPELKSFAGIDIEVLARVFITTMDDFLSAATGPKAWNIQHSVAQAAGDDPETAPFQVIEQAKKDIAAAIAQYQLSPILQGEDTGGQEEAREALRQQLLITLGSVYTVDAILQNKVTVTTGFATHKANLFGTLKSSKNDIPANAYSFTPVKVALTTAGSGQEANGLNTLFSVRQEASQGGASQDVDLIAAFKADLNYQITALEHDFGTPINGYIPSSWLTFVHPIICTGANDTPLLKADIPIPLKAYPTAPSMISQAGVGVPIDPADKEPKEILAEVQKWDYEFAYDYIAAQQDSVYLNVMFNVLPAQVGARAVVQLDLFEALLQFNASYRDILDDLEKQNADSLIALQSFAWIIQQVATAWSVWFGGNMQAARLSAHQLDFVITEFEGKDASASAYLLLKVSPLDSNPAGAPVPLITIPGFETRTLPAANGDAVTYYFEKVLDHVGEPLLYADRKQYSQRMVKLPGRSILIDENAWAGVSIHRNEILTGKPANKDFLYITPYIRFADLCLPGLNNETPINIADFSPVILPPGKTTLNVFLENFFKELLKDMKEPTIVMQLQCGYSYTLQAPDDLADEVALRPTLPILLTPPVKTDWSTTPPLVGNVATSIKEWIKLFQPEGVDSTGRLQIVLSLFASLSEDLNNPLLKLAGLFLDTTVIDFS